MREMSCRFATFPSHCGHGGYGPDTPHSFKACTAERQTDVPRYSRQNGGRRPFTGVQDHPASVEHSELSERLFAEAIVVEAIDSTNCVEWSKSWVMVSSAKPAPNSPVMMQNRATSPNPSHRLIGVIENGRAF